MIGVVWLNEAVGWQVSRFAVGGELIEGRKKTLVLNEIDDLHGGARSVIVVEFRALPSVLQPFIDRRNLVAVRFGDQEHVHVHVAKRSSIVSKCPVANRWTRNRCKPSIEDRILSGQSREDRNLFRGEIVHDGMRSLRAGSLSRIALDKALHVGHTSRSKWGATIDLQIYSGEMMVRIMCQLSAINGTGGYGNQVSIRIR